MRKILRPKFWSQGTPLGSMGPLSLKAPDQRFSKHDFLLIWDPYDFPKLAASSALAKKLIGIAAWCDAIATGILGMCVMLSFFAFLALVELYCSQ